jgi:hypothetical protein
LKGEIENNKTFIWGIKTIRTKLKHEKLGSND